MTTTPQLLIDLVERLDAPQGRLHRLDEYYCGTQPLSFIAPEARAALGSRLARVSVNIPRLAVTALADRCRITGWTGDAQLWSDWIRNDLDLQHGIAHREALAFGSAAAIVWADAQGRPTVSIESRRQVAWLTDPQTRIVTSAVKRWRTDRETHVMVYEPDVIRHYRAGSPGATNSGFELIEEISNPLGQVVVVPIVNADRILEPDGMSEIWDLAPLTDALVKVTTDMLVSSEMTGLPQRYATGLVPEERPVFDATGEQVIDPGTGLPTTELVNPLSTELGRTWLSQEPTSRFGTLPAGDLGGYEAAVRILLTQIQAVSALPGSMLGVLSDQPTSADSLRASESALTAKAETRQALFGKCWEQVGRLMVAVRDGADPAEVEVHPQWCDPGTASESQAVDAATKLYQSGLLSREGTLKRLGFTDSDIADEMARIDRDAQNARDITVGRYMTGQTDR